MESSETTRFRHVTRSYEEFGNGSGRKNFSRLNFDQGLPSPTGSYRAGKGRKGEAEKPGTLTLFCVLGFLLAVFVFVRVRDFTLPTPLTVADLAEHPKSFIEERAWADLKLLTSVGPRVAGSHVNDVVTVDALTRIVQEIQRTKNPVHKIEFDVQRPTGSFFLSFQDGQTSSYSNIPNFIVKLEAAGARRQENNSILVNCHFDTTAGSPGASDDMSGCVVMLEALRVLSRQPTPIKNSIVFLFNGAEENILQGAHGFLKGKEVGKEEVGHRWSKDLRCFVNLEAAGAGAREILFQTGPGNGWLVEVYKNVPYPFGSVMGEEIFQRGLIPSDTDFRIFRDFAKIPGLDMAFVKNGYVYHTKFDSIENVTPGSLQHEGSNVLALLENLGNMDFSKVVYSGSKMVFFDVFGYFTVVYTEETAIVVNILLGLIMLVVTWNEVDRSWKTLAWLIFATLAAWTVGALCSVATGIGLTAAQMYSPFHSYPMSVLLLFGVPCLAGQVIVYSLALKGSEDYTWFAGKATLALGIIGATMFTRVVFSVTYNILFGLIGWYLARVLFKGPKSRMAFYLGVGEAFPLALSLYLVTGCLDTFVPIMGRSGTENDPNLFVAVLVSITLILPTMSGIVPIFVFFKKPFLRICAVLLVAIAAVMILFNGRIPYHEDTPMRIHLIEVDRSYFGTDLTTKTKSDSGFWMFNVDPNIPMFYDMLGEDIPELKHENHEEIDVYHCEDLFCGLPFIFPVKKLVRRTHWISKPKGLSEEIKSRVRMDLVEDSFIRPDLRRVTLSFIGSDHLTINFSPGRNYDLVQWSLTDEIPEPMNMPWKGRPTYFVYHARGVSFERFNVTLDFKRKDNYDPSSTDPLVDINYSSFYLHGEEMKSQDLQTFIRKLPSWSYVLGFSAVSHVYAIPI